VPIIVRRDLIGGVSGALFALALTAFLLGSIEPGFRPLVVGSLVLGGLCAVVLVWQRRRGGHPSISRHASSREDPPAIEPK
jgi:hypothetical protein